MMTLSNGWLLDSTYIMPFFGINVNIPDIKKDLAKILSANPSKIFTTTCSLIEAKWKAIRNYLKSGDRTHLKRANHALESFQQNKYISLIDAWFVRDASNWADQLLMEGHQDYMDCWIAGTAKVKNLVLVTEDRPLCELIKTLPSWQTLTYLNWTNFVRIDFTQ